MSRLLAGRASNPDADDVVHMQPQPGESTNLWQAAGLVLAAGGAVPTILTVSYAVHQGSNLSAWELTAGAVALDLLYVATATAFLRVGRAFGEQLHGTTAGYPGAFVEADGSRRTPSGFMAYVIVLPLTTGLIVPAAALAYLLWQQQIEVAVATVGVYLLGVLVQIFNEEAFLRPKGHGSPMWPQVPQVYQTYRIWQLARGWWITSLLGGPSWLIMLQQYLIVLWMGNFGAVMTWSPWLYRWHLQPETEVAPDDEKKEK